MAVNGIERELGGINEKLGNIEKVLKDVAEGQQKLPCKQAKDNPLTEIEKLKRDMGFFRWFGGIIFTGIGGLVFWILRKPFNGG